ncbi:MAG: hypothetical protein AAGF24_10685 [Cyanobacteria bacterium P01_H01_bin.121]
MLKPMLSGVGSIHTVRSPGQRPVISILGLILVGMAQACNHSPLPDHVIPKAGSTGSEASGTASVVPTFKPNPSQAIAIEELTQLNSTAVDTLNGVQLEGTVNQVAPLLEGQVYLLDDQTAQVWVLSPDSTLTPGQQVVIEGDVTYADITIEGQSFGEVYIQERARNVQPSK